MWRFKPFVTKEQTGLEGRYIDVGNVKVNVKNIIAEGGFSCVYLARDAVTTSRQYALKHIICNDDESLQLVMKEIKVMKSLKGHPNVVNLHSHAIFDMGRTKEALIVMDLCEKSLVSVLESRGSGYFEEEKVLIIFRDVCNAVFAMHCRSLPIAHRDLKAENILLGQDGLWKLCDFGSTSTNHKCFEKPEEMGIEEDNIRKHTTPAYRAPEMWDLFRKELINEKVDIWALGCLLFRICYFKSAFDGESKLQVLNGNYRIPDLPKYSSAVTDLIRDMLQSSPDARPDITQVWFRVNQQLPAALQKSLPDQLPEFPETAANMPEANKASAARRSPPPPPPSETTRTSSPPHAKVGRAAGSPLGAFWTTQHAQDSISKDRKNAPKIEDERTSYGTVKQDQSFLDKLHVSGTNPSSKSSELKFSVEDANHGNERSKEKEPDSVGTFGNETFNAFVADFDTSKIGSSVCRSRPGKSGSSEAEIEGLREQLKRANLEKAEITSKYEKLAAICRSQRQEIQELKQALRTKASSPSKDELKNQSSTENQTSAAPPRKIEGPAWELQQGVLDKHSPSLESRVWQPFVDESQPQMTSRTDGPKSVRTSNGHQKKQNSTAPSNNDGWGFGNENFTAVPAASSLITKSAGEGGSSQRFGGSNRKDNKAASQPAGWSGF